MSSPDDRTARARIRDEALRLFAERGADAVTLRDVAAAAGVSAALVVRHYGSKDGLEAAVEAHVVDTFDALVGRLADDAAHHGLGAEAATGMLGLLADRMPPGSSVPAYVGRLLVAGGPSATALFARLHGLARAALASMAAAGVADAGPDPDVRAAFLLCNDLGVLMLRARLAETLDLDVLTRAGMARWSAEVLAVYGGGLGGGAPRSRAQPRDHRHEHPTESEDPA